MDESSGLELILEVVGPLLPVPGCCSSSSPQQGSTAPRAAQLRFSFADNPRYCSGVALPVVSRLTFSRVLHIADGLMLSLQPPEGVREHCQLTIFSCLSSPALALGLLVPLMCL